MMHRAVFPAMLTPQECRATIAAAEAGGFEAMGPRYPDAYRNNDRALLDDAGLADRLFARLHPHLPQRWEEDGARWRLTGLNSRFRFCRYRDGQSFTRHRDGAWSRTSGERSWLTVMLYLNDGGEFAGGATRFYEDEAVVDSVPPREGQAIVFDHRAWHDGEAVHEGVKYVMRTDVMYALEQPGVAAAPEARGDLVPERVCSGHAGYVWVVRRLGDGRLVSGSRDCTVRRWGDGEIVRSGLASSATALVEAGGALWVGGRHGRIDDGRRDWPAHDGAVLGLERETDGSVLSCGADGAIRRWSPAGEPMGEVARHDGWVWGLALDGERVRAAVEPVTAAAPGAAGHRDGTIVLDGGRSWAAHAGAVTALARLADGRWVSGGEDCAVKLWSAAGTLLGEGAHGDFVRSVAVLDARRFATASYDGTGVIWRAAGNQSARRDK
jgi:WD40 repeat protein